MEFKRARHGFIVNRTHMRIDGRVFALDGAVVVDKEGLVVVSRRKG